MISSSRRFYIFTVLIPIIVSGCISTPGPLIQHYSSHFNDRELKYYLLLPKTSDAHTKPPLLILFHGVGEDAMDYMESFEDFAKDRQIGLLSPEINIDRRTGEAAFLEHVELLIKQVEQQNNIDSRQVMICGVSAGGILAQNLMLMSPSRYSQTVVASAPLVESPLWDRARDVPFPKMLIVYGESDEQIDVLEMKKDIDQLRTQGVSAEEYIISSAGHDDWRDWIEPIFGWLGTE